jgi:hypothetical protein
MDPMALVNSILSDLMNGIFSARLLLLIWMGGLVVAGAVLFFFGKLAGRRSNWGHVQGWQNEIATWNLSMILVLGGILMSGKGNESYALPGLIVMALGFSINHIVAMYRSKSMPQTHLSATIANIGGILLTIIYYIAGK